jgi:hypothetical protein
MTIFSLLALMVYGAFYLGHRAVMKGERHADISQRVRLAAEILARQVRSAVFYFARDDEEGYPYFLGRADEMSFVSAAPQSRGGTGLAVVSYRVEEGRLLMEERIAFTPEDLYEPPSEARQERGVLLEGFSAIRFEYIPHEEVDAWQPAWDGREEESLPAAVRVTIDGLEFFEFHPWVQEIPVMTVAYGWGTDEFLEPPEEDQDWDGEDGEPDEELDGDAEP